MWVLAALAVVVGILFALAKRLDKGPRRITHNQLKSDRWMVYNGYARADSLGSYCSVHLSNTCSHTPEEAQAERAYAEAMAPIEDAFTREMAKVEREYDRRVAREEYQKISATWGDEPLGFIEAKTHAIQAAMIDAHLRQDRELWAHRALIDDDLDRVQVDSWGSVTPIRTDDEPTYFVGEQVIS